MNFPLMQRFQKSPWSETQPVEKNNKFVTHKKNADRHGLGVESVRRIMEKYQGEISFEYKSGFFEVSIIITQ